MKFTSVCINIVLVDLKGGYTMCGRFAKQGKNEAHGVIRDIQSRRF